VNKHTAVSSKFVPQLLSDKQKQHRLLVCQAELDAVTSDQGS